MGPGSNSVKNGLNVKLYCPYGHHVSALAIAVIAHPSVLLYPTSVQYRRTTAANFEKERQVEMMSASEGRSCWGEKL